MLLSSVLFICVWGYVSAHTYHLGECPAVEPMANFDMDKFLGKWYVIQKTSTGSSCLINNYTKNEDDGQYKLEQISEHFLLGLTSYDHKYHYTGELMIPNKYLPAQMKVKFPLSVAGSAEYTVFMTDYSTYAGVFTCQKLAFAHRRSATILSRSSSLDKMYVDKIRNKLASSGMDVHTLSIINHDDCNKPSDDTTNINIDPDTFSTSSVTNAVRKAGEKIGEGADAIADSAKKLYNKVRGDERDSKEEINRDQDAEWLP